MIGFVVGYLLGSQETESKGGKSSLECELLLEQIFKDLDEKTVN